MVGKGVGKGVGWKTSLRETMTADMLSVDPLARQWISSSLLSWPSVEAGEPSYRSFTT